MRGGGVKQSVNVQKSVSRRWCHTSDRLSCLVLLSKGLGKRCIDTDGNYIAKHLRRYLFKGWASWNFYTQRRRILG